MHHYAPVSCRTHCRTQKTTKDGARRLRLCRKGKRKQYENVSDVKSETVFAPFMKTAEIVENTGFFALVFFDLSDFFCYGRYFVPLLFMLFLQVERLFDLVAAHSVVVCLDLVLLSVDFVELFPKLDIFRAYAVAVR